MSLGGNNETVADCGSSVMGWTRIGWVQYGFGSFAASDMWVWVGLLRAGSSGGWSHSLARRGAMSFVGAVIGFFVGIRHALIPS